MKKILIPIDFSTCSQHAAKLASRIGRISKSEVHLLHMIELPKGYIDKTSKKPLSIPQNILYIQKTKELLHKYKEKFFHKNKRVISTILFENPSEGILNYTKKIDSDLIVMGSKGHSKIEELIIGSNTQKIIQTAKTPVLIVKKDESKFKLKNLVFASDFKVRNTENKALKKLLDFAGKFKSSFHLLKINTPNIFENSQKSKQKMRLFAKEHLLPKYTINTQNDSSIEEGIINFTNEVSGDIIAIESYGRSNLSHFFNRSITKYLSKSTMQPIIVFKT